MSEEVAVAMPAYAASEAWPAPRPRAVRVSREPGPRWQARLIRVIDVVFALCALVVFAPFMLALALAVKLEDGGPVFYAQTRMGRGGEPFPCLKYRSMVRDADARLQALLAADAAAQAEWAKDHKLRRDPRITSVGRVLRTSSLDELPQLLNVLRGDMSLVGPRPIVEREVVRYGRRYATYCKVRPGITGLWQVSGRNDTTYRRRVALDHCFVRSYGLMLYLKLLAATVPAVLLRRGSY